MLKIERIHHPFSDPPDESWTHYHFRAHGRDVFTRVDGQHGSAGDLVELAFDPENPQEPVDGELWNVLEFAVAILALLMIVTLRGKLRWVFAVFAHRRELRLSAAGRR